MPRVSVIITARNEEALIAEALGSVLAQSYRDFEVVVVDDGSDDRTTEVAEALSDPRVRVIRQPRIGRAAALNLAVAASSGEFLAPQDADDLWLPERLSRQVAFLDAHPEIALVGAGVMIRDARGRDRLYLRPTSDRAIRLAMGWGNPIVHTAALIRRRAMEVVGPYADTLFEDYELFIRIAESHLVANLPGVLVVVRKTRPGSRSRAVARGLAQREKLRLQRLAIERLRLPPRARLGLLRTLAATALFSTFEKIARPTGPAP
ncbi:MAG: glycosyltransferase [bacterium]|nr:glycosyltransferase [bacterium]